jgi:hypothetical protein
MAAMNRLRTIWRKRMAAAARNYIAAMAATKQAIHERDSLPSLEQCEAVRRALQSEDVARQEYVQALDAYSRLGGDKPEPPDRD